MIMLPWGSRTSAKLCPCKAVLRSGVAGGLVTFVLLFAPVADLSPATRSHQISRVDRDLAEAMLKNVSCDVQRHYYDPKLKGLNWDALVHEAKVNIERAPNMVTAIAQIEALLEHLQDSHTFFISPGDVNKIDYGWHFKVIGKRAFVTSVTPQSDAERKGMRPGEELLTIDGFTVDRASTLNLKYALDFLVPQSNLNVALRDRAGKLVRLNVASTIQKHTAIAGLGDYFWYLNQRIINFENAWNNEKARYKELGPELMIVRVPAFFETGLAVDAIFEKARSHRSLIVDLRGTPGGRLDSVVDYLAHILIQDAKVGDFVGRDGTKPILIKRNRRNAFAGDLIVLVDSETGSAAEIFARAVQLEERGTILGDHTAGRTMEARYYMHRYGHNPVYDYGALVTVADPIMADGKSLERVGVEPDRTFLPTEADLAAGRDPVLAYAAGLAGVKLSPEEAAKLFPRTSRTM